MLKNFPCAYFCVVSPTESFILGHSYFHKLLIWHLSLQTWNVITFPEICQFNLQQYIIFAVSNISYIKRLSVVEEKGFISSNAVKFLYLAERSLIKFPKLIEFVWNNFAKIWLSVQEKNNQYMYTQIFHLTTSSNTYPYSNV